MAIFPLSNFCLKSVALDLTICLARDSLSVKLINGKLPENKNEIAVTDNMLEILNVNIGDTVTLDMTSDNPGQRKFVITGTVNDYYSLFTNGEHQLVASDNSVRYYVFLQIIILFSA